MKNGQNPTYIALFERRNKPQNMLTFSEALPIWLVIRSTPKYIVYASRKVFRHMPESLETVNSGGFGNQSAILLRDITTVLKFRDILDCYVHSVLL